MDGGGSAAGDGAGTAVRGAALLISEVMYHPVLEDGPVEEHEFLEIHNRGATPVALDGWRIGGAITYAFPADAVLAPGRYLVVAKNRDKLLALEAYRLSPGDVVGDYQGELGNGGATVSLWDPTGNPVETVAYSDEFPWPIGADALGAQEEFLPADVLPLDKHKYLGRSLERMSFDVPADAVANWIASPLDGATPGRANSSAGAPLPVVEALAQGGKLSVIGPDDKVPIDVSFGARGMVAKPEVEFFVDDLEKTGEPVTKMEMSGVGDRFVAVLPTRPANSVVRYRIAGDRGAGREIISPRPSDPFAWHAYFVAPAPASPGRAYHAFIKVGDWSQMWTHVQPGRVIGTCTPNADWDATVPAVFVSEGVVYDVRARYAGSRVHRTRYMDAPFTGWTGAVPAGPKPLGALNWRFIFPRYRPFEGKRPGVHLSKLVDSCPGSNWIVESALMNAAGIPAVDVRFARLYLNGGYYHYMMDKEDVDGALIAKRWKGQEVGDLYKTEGGSTVDQGPFGVTDGRVITDGCMFTARQRYEYSYSRQTNKWKGPPDDVATLLKALGTARAGGAAAMRKFFADRFDVDLLTTYLAIRNWTAPWDDSFHNYMLYRRADGKWLILPDDYDGELGAARMWRGDVSFFVGEEGDLDNTGPEWWNLIKDAFFKSYRTELKQRLADLDKTILDPAKVLPMIDEAAKQVSLADWMASPAGVACDVNASVEGMKVFVHARHDAVSKL